MTAHSNASAMRFKTNIKDFRRVHIGIGSQLGIADLQEG